MPLPPTRKLLPTVQPIQAIRIPPDIRTSLDWSPFDEACIRATESELPILAVVAAWWTNGAQMIGRVLEDADLRNLIEQNFVPTLIDPSEEFPLAAKLHLSAEHLMGSAGTPLIAILTPTRDLFVASTTLNLAGDDITPSLRSLLDVTAETWRSDREGCYEEAERIRRVLSEPLPDPIRDSDHGGFVEAQKHFHPDRMLSEISKNPSDSWIANTLDTIWKRGVRDQLEPSFHFCARDQRWIVPHFEKPVPLNARIAEVYATAARRTTTRRWRSHAQDLIRFCLLALRQDYDALASDSDYYTWLSTEALSATTRETLHTVSLLYHIVPGSYRLVLSEAMSFQDMANLSHEDEQVLRQRLIKGQAELLMARRARPSPHPVKQSGIAWRAETFRALLNATGMLESTEHELISDLLDAWLQHLTLHTAGGFVCSQDDTPRFEDQVGFLACLLTARNQTGLPSVEAMWQPTYDYVSEELERWGEKPPEEIVWLRYGDVIPAVTDTLARVNALLPEGFSIQVPKAISEA